jgi:hypothetical protein
MARFAGPNNLLQHLKVSGLFALGVDSAALFWDIINTTWTKGSTTRCGYKKVMQERIVESYTGPADISVAVSNFVDAYLENSRIDEHWRPVFEIISSDKSVQVIIATDHYAEATDAIIMHFARWDIQASTLTGNCTSRVVVANSADLGVHKDRRQFWRIVRNVLQQKFRHILLIDDFGYNEQQGDDYGDVNKADERQRMTVRILREVFAADVKSIPFTDKDGQTAESINEISAIIEQFLVKKPK